MGLISIRIDKDRDPQSYHYNVLGSTKNPITEPIIFKRKPNFRGPFQPASAAIASTTLPTIILRKFAFLTLEINFRLGILLIACIQD